MHKKSIGFNWGPCAVSTGYWTGVRMSTLLKLAGVQTGSAGYVSFRGPKGELPKGDDGSYGESCPSVIAPVVSKAGHIERMLVRNACKVGTAAQLASVHRQTAAAFRALSLKVQ
jgi:hypothetical protein